MRAAEHARGVMESHSLRRRVYETLDTDPDTEPGLYWITIALIVIIGANAVAVILESVQSIGDAYAPWFRAFEYVSLAIFGVEYLLRLWSVTADPRYQHPVWGRLRYMVTPAALIDLAAILPSTLQVVGVIRTDTRALFLLRFFRLFRLLKLGRYTPAVHHLSEVFKEKRADLTVALGAAGILLVLSSSAMYIAEKDAQPDKFGSIPQAMWWSIVTLTTIGYGDAVPIKTLGKVLGGVTALMGIGIVALPTAILASGFNDRLQKRREGKEQKRSITPSGPAHAEGETCPHCGRVLAEARAP